MKKTSEKDLNYKYVSPEEPGFHTVITPENSPCKVTHIFRLNLPAGEFYQLVNNHLELSIMIISGSISVFKGSKNYGILNSRDSFYLPSEIQVTIKAETDTVIFIGGGPCEKMGRFFIRKYMAGLPLSDVHQIHGKPPYQRDVFMAVHPEAEASRIISGITVGEDGCWTSWPPHQHSRDLEEVYCYFDIPRPGFVLHLSWREPGMVEDVYTVSTGDCVVIPEGYHPTVSIPGLRSSYFWVMVAHSHEQRKYDLAESDPNFDQQPMQTLSD